MGKKIKRLIMKKSWNQFEKFELDFHDKVTILTGKNGVGKSTLLRMIARTFSSEQPNEVYNGMTSLSISELKKIADILSKKTINQNGAYYNFDLSADKIPSIFLESIKRQELDFETITHIEFEDAIVKLELPIESINNNTWNYDFNLEIKKDGENSWEYYSAKYGYGNVQENVYDPGISISSHKSPYIYSKIGYIPNGFWKKEVSFSQYLASANYQHNITNSVPEIRNPHEVIKQSIISMILFSADSSHVTENKEIKEETERFIRLLKLVLPEEIGFNNIVIDRSTGEIIFETETGRFLLDSLSGGMGAIIDIVWQLFMAVPIDGDYFVLIDELENHLHPSMQRDILPKLCKAFPNVQFIISTHSPFIVNSVEDSFIYILDHNENKKVELKKIEDYKYDLAKSNDDILYNILDVPTTLPIWAEKKFSKILAKYKNTNLSNEQFSNLQTDMKDANIESLLSDLIFDINNEGESND
ncbi:MAG: ATP-binding protein [Carnobacterium sp.]|uniref:AAA family ATPase n=1 Tax=Carnobacterium sp. TaxID=48221 RepID=UPI003316004E